MVFSSLVLLLKIAPKLAKTPRAAPVIAMGAEIIVVAASRATPPLPIPLAAAMLEQYHTQPRL